jgi:hypothetical protein
MNQSHQPYPQGQYAPQPHYQPAPQVIVTKRGANHGLHLVLSILTAGLWAVTGWPIAALMGRKEKTRVR